MLELENISFKIYDDNREKEILKNINIKFDNKKFIVITGPNGSGKSTLAKLIAGAITPTQGRILLDGIDITHLSMTERAKMGIGYAFQQPVRFKGIKVYDLLKIASQSILTEKQACKYLCEVGLCANSYLEREINNSLSGGELKRIEIATVLARQSRLAIFDEPEAGIDLWSFQKLTKVFYTMRERIDNGIIIVISHQERILNISDEIVVVSNGTITKQGAKDAIISQILSNDSTVKICKRLKIRNKYYENE